MRRLIVITDPAALGDDVVALAMLAGTLQADVRLVVATSGNVWAEEAVHNARALLARLGREDIDICMGTPSLAFQDRYHAIADCSCPPGALRYIGAFSRKLPNSLEAFRKSNNLFELIAGARQPNLIIIGPASPLASIIRMHPELKDNIGRIYLMGGALRCEGNATPSAEFNFWFDPAAAEALLAGNLPITLLPLDVVRNLHYSDEFAATLDPRHPVTEYIRNSVENVSSPPVCDEVMAAVAIDHTLISRSRAMKLSVEKRGPRYGAVNILNNNARRRPVQVIEQINEAAFWRLATRMLARC